MEKKAPLDVIDLLGNVSYEHEFEKAIEKYEF